MAEQLFIVGPMQVRIGEGTSEVLEQAWQEVGKYVKIAIDARRLDEVAADLAAAPAPQKVRIQVVGGRTALLDGPECDAFLLAVNRRAPGSMLAVHSTPVVRWQYENETVWRNLE